MENVPDPIEIALNFVNYWERLGKLSYKGSRYVRWIVEYVQCVYILDVRS